MRAISRLGVVLLAGCAANLGAANDSRAQEAAIGGTPPAFIGSDAPPPGMMFQGGPVWDPRMPMPVSPMLYRGPNSEYALGPDRRAMPEYCYPGRLTGYGSTDDLPGDWRGPPPPPPSCGDLWEDTHTPQRWWLSLAYLSLWTTGSSTPPLATTSPAGTAQAAAGILPAATVLFGNEEIDDEQRDGAEIRFGHWLVDGQFIGLEGHYWATQRMGTEFVVSSTFVNGAGGTILARPFFDLVAAVNDAVIVAFPNFNRGGNVFDLNGLISVHSTSIMQSAGLTGRHIMLADFERAFRIDLIGGYRFFQLDESLRVGDQFSDPGGGLVGPTTFQTNDLFDTQNDLHLLELGLLYEQHYGRWEFSVLGKCGMGNNHERVRISGSTTTTSLGTTATTAAGLLAQPTNIGTYRRDRFAVLPELNAKLKYDVSESWQVFGGYRMMYLNEALRPGDQIDTTLNTSQVGGGVLVGGARPGHTFLSTDMWVHGLEFGVEWKR